MRGAGKHTEADRDVFSPWRSPVLRVMKSATDRGAAAEKAAAKRKGNADANKAAATRKANAAAMKRSQAAVKAAAARKTNAAAKKRGEAGVKAAAKKKANAAARRRNEAAKKANETRKRNAALKAAGSTPETVAPVESSPEQCNASSHAGSRTQRSEGPPAKSPRTRPPDPRHPRRYSRTPGSAISTAPIFFLLILAAAARFTTAKLLPACPTKAHIGGRTAPQPVDDAFRPPPHIEGASRGSQA